MSQDPAKPLATASPQRALLETTVQIDRRKTAHRQQVIDSLLLGYDWKFSTSISLLEFKATFLNACIFLHDAFRRGNVGFGEMLDAVTESAHYQQRLRVHILHRLLQVVGGLFRNDPNRDTRQAEMARLQLETIIPEAYDWFSSSECVDQILKTRIGCTRAAERPKKQLARFATNLPVCNRKTNKHCHVEAAIRQHGARHVQKLEQHATPSDSSEPNQFRRTLTVIQKVIANAKAELSHSDCRSAGDFLIGIEAEGSVTHALSTNASEWRIVSELIGAEFVHVQYPNERPWN